MRAGLGGAGHSRIGELPSVMESDIIQQLAQLRERVAELESQLASRADSQAADDHRYAIELSPQAPWIAAPDGAIVEFHRRWLELTGLTREQALGDGWVNVQHPDDLPAMVKAWTHTVQTGEPYDVEHRIRLANGEFRWMRSRAFPRRDTDGRIVRWYGTTEDIDAQKQAELNSNALHEQFEAIVQFTPSPIVTLTEAGIVTLWNPAAERLFGWTAEEVIGKPLPFLAGSEQAEDHSHRNQGVNDVELRRVRKDGTAVDVRVSTATLYDPSGAVMGVLKLYADITAQKQAEQRIARQWRIFDTALSHTPDSTYIFDRDGGVIYANRTLLSRWQKSLEQVLGKKLSELGYPPDFAEKVQRQIAAVIETGQSVRDETPLTNFTENTRHYEYIFVPVFGQDGKVEAIAGSTRDVTERQNARLALESANGELESTRRQLTSIFESMTDAFFALDRDWKFTYVNRQAELLLIRTRDALLGKSIWDEFAPAVNSNFYHQYHRAMAERVPVEFEEYYEPLKTWFEVRAYPSSEGLGVYFHNFNERKASQEALLRQAHELARTNADLEQFAYTASHDLREPLRMVSIFTELLQRKYAGKLDSQAEEYIAHAVQGANRMEMLVRDLLAYSQAGADGEGSPGLVDANEVLARVQATMQLSIAQSGAVISCAQLPQIWMQPVHLQQIFQNLIANALKYRSQHVPQIHVAAIRQDAEWVFSVRDNGIGIDPQYAEQVFGIFKRLHNKDEYEGTGIGLAICQKIVERYRGRIWVESELGRGSAFFFSIPISR